MEPATVVTTYPSRVILTCCGPDVPHQIRTGQLGITVDETRLYVSCVCRRLAGEVYDPLDVREVYEPGDALAVWQAHMKEVAA
jgi:hypothetical protein